MGSSIAPQIELWSMQQAENGDAGGGADEPLAVGKRRRDEFVASAEMISIACRLVAVVELVREIRGVIGVQHRRVGILMRPNDGVGRAVRRYAGRRTWI